MLSVKREPEADASDDTNPYAWRQAPGPLQPAQLLLAAPDDSDDDVVIPKRAMLTKPRLASVVNRTQDDSDDDVVITRRAVLPKAHLGSAAIRPQHDSDDDKVIQKPRVSSVPTKTTAEQFMVDRMAFLKREADAREAKVVAERADFNIRNPGIQEEYMFMVNNFYTGDLKKTDEGANRMMQYMVNVRLNPRNLRRETADRHAAVAIAIPAYVSGVYFVEGYMYLNIHKYPSFYEHMTADKQKMTLTSKRLCTFFSGDRTNIEKSFSSYRRYAGLLYYTHKLEDEIEAGAASLYSTANTVSYMLSVSIQLVNNQFNIVFYPEITRESVQQYVATKVLAAIGKVRDKSDLRMQFCRAVADYAEEVFYDDDAAVLKALQAMLHNVMLVQESTIKRRLQAVLDREVVNADD